MRPTRLVTLAAVLAVPSMAAAQGPTVSDIALCNQEAESATGGSAVPRMTQPRPGPERPGDSAVQHGVPATPEARSSSGSAPTTRGSDAGTATDSSGKIVTRAPDPLLEGMAADRLDDPEYRTAYRDCMQRQLRTPGR
jgi:hypothetical protein